MRRKFLCLLIASTLGIAALTGCDDASDSTNDTTNTAHKSTTNNENATTTKTEDSSDTDTTKNTADTPSEGSTTNTSSENTEPETLINPSGSTTYKFTSLVTGEGFTEQLTSTEDEKWSYNKTHYVNPDDDIMNFSWEGPTGIGEVAYSTTSGTALIMKNSTGEFALRAFTTGQAPTETFDATKSWSREQIVACVHKDVSYIKDGYYDSNISDNTLIYTFAIESQIDEKDHKGYAYFIMIRDTGLCYQFYYLENIDVYDDARALKVIGSLKPIEADDFETDIEE